MNIAPMLPAASNPLYDTVELGYWYVSSDCVNFWTILAVVSGFFLFMLGINSKRFQTFRQMWRANPFPLSQSAPRSCLQTDHGPLLSPQRLRILRIGRDDRVHLNHESVTRKTCT